MAERCEYCGRFMTHVWNRTNEHDDSWDDWWACSQERKHIADHPQDWGHKDA